MRILFSDQLLVFGAIVLAAWLLVRFVLVPRTQLAVAAAKSGQVVKLGGRFGFLLTLRSLLDAMLVAGVLVVAFAAALQWYIAGYSDTPTAIAKVVKVRDTVERAIDSLSLLSGEAWVASLAALALICLVASRSASRRSWDSALNARRSALRAEVADLTGDDLLARANTLDANGVAEIERKVQSIISDNASRIQDFQSTPIVKTGDDPQRVASLDDLRNFEQSMRTRATDDEATDMTHEQRADLAKSADGLHEKIEEIESQVMLSLRTVDGTRDVSLAQALADPKAAIQLQEQWEISLRHLVVEAQVSNHTSLGVKKLRREPELIREWLGAVPTGVAAVRAASVMGRSAGLACLILLFVGFVSLGVVGLGPVLVSQAAALELKLAAQGADSDLSAAMQQEIPPAPPSNAELASDNATVDFLRQSFRASIARSFQTDFVRVQARERFALGAIEARQKLLLASTRPAAPSLEPGQAPRTYRFSENVHASAVENPIAVLDEALHRRIKTLRANEGLWVQLRMAAARPAPADLAAEALFKTALLTGDVGRTNTFHVWAERASQDFAAQTARLGHPPGVDYHVPSFSDEHLISARDRRLVGDYRAQVPQEVKQTLAGVRDGSLDPGSLHRELPGAVARHSVYGDLFPASSAPGGGGFSGGGGGGGGGFSGGGGGGTKGASPPTRVASTPPARSYAKVRFSGKIGGVLIGISPQPGGDEIDVHGFKAQIASNRLFLTLTDSTGQQVKLGPYHPAIAHHALAYAADGRVVTSTLPQPQVSPNDEIELDARRVVVHPAFEDTAFACPAIEVDRFVDTFTNRNQPDELINRINTVRFAVTDLGRLIPQTRVAASTPVSDGIRQLTQNVAKHAQTCGVGSKCFPIADYKNYGLNFGDTPDFISCLARKEEPGSCLSTLRRGPRAAVTYLVDSGVREAPFALDKKLLFLTGANRTNDPLWPLDFMIQAVPQALTDADVVIRDQWEPWRFPTIDSLIKEAVAKGIATDPNARSVLATMRDFTILQRLFRLALAGDLGLSFPLEELVKLQQATAGFVRIERSERWNVNQSLLQTMASEHDRLKTMLTQIISRENVPETCRTAAHSAIQGSRGWPEADGLWTSVGQVEKACQGTSAARPLVSRLALLRQHDLVDEAIRWRQSYRTPRAPFTCSPL